MHVDCAGLGAGVGLSLLGLWEGLYVENGGASGFNCKRRWLGKCLADSVSLGCGESGVQGTEARVGGWTWVGMKRCSFRALHVWVVVLTLGTSFTAQRMSPD